MHKILHVIIENKHKVNITYTKFNKAVHILYVFDVMFHFIVYSVNLNFSATVLNALQV